MLFFKSHHGTDPQDASQAEKSQALSSGFQYFAKEAMRAYARVVPCRYGTPREKSTNPGQGF